MGRLGLAFVLAMAAWWMLPRPHAAAHPDVDEGRRLAREADFERALEAFARAENATNLTREELVALLEGRALVYLGLSSQSAMEADLLRLAALDPQHRFAPDLPPDLADAFTRVLASSPGPLELEVSVVRDASGVVLRARLVHDVGLVRDVRLHASTSTGGWQSSTERAWRVRVRRDEPVWFHAEAVGPGGAVLVLAGSPEAPRVARPQPLASPTRGRGASRRDAASRGHPGSSGPGAWPWLLAGGGALVVGATVLIVVLASGSTTTTDQTLPGYPRVEGLP